MRKKDLSKHMSGIYFLEKTSYEDSKQRHLKISFVLPGTVCMYIFVVTTVGMFMDAVQFSWNLKTVLIWAALGCMLPGIFCLHKKGFWVGMTLLTAISIGFWLNSDGQIWAGVLDVYERIGDLIHVYYSGASRNFNLSGNVSDNFLIAFVLLLCIYEGVFILGLKRSLGGAIPGIAVGTGCLLVGQVPQLLWLYLFIFTCQLHQYSFWKCQYAGTLDAAFLYSWETVGIGSNQSVRSHKSDRDSSSGDMCGCGCCSVCAAAG